MGNAMKGRAQKNHAGGAAFLGNLVRDARKRRALSQTALAQKARLNQKTISAIENGAEGTEIGTVLRVFEELGLRIGVEPANKASGPKKQDVLRSLRKVKAQLKAAGVASLALFGSTARGDAGPESDVDIMVDLSIAPSIANIAKVQDLLDEAIGHKVDFTLRDSLRGEVLAQAEREAIYVI
jgi:predicted nucleotidyltransferase/DNA-binding XRE family transcriptional regulator